jgi:hypothetical protein
MSKPLPPSASWQWYDTNAKHFLCNTGVPCCLSLCYPCHFVYMAKLVKNYVIITCTAKHYFSGLWISQKKVFPIWARVPFCPNLLLTHPTTCFSSYKFSPLFTSASALCVLGFLLFSLWWCLKFTTLAAVLSEEHSCSSAICRRKCTSYNIHMKFDITFLK